MSSAELPAPQIGRILIAAGLLTEDQLAEALEEQAQTSRRLGEIVVQRGFISGPALANALAEQHGGVLKTEYGFATGLGGEVAKRAAAQPAAEAEPNPPLPRLRTVELPVEEAASDTQSEAPPPEPEPKPEPEPVIEPPPEPLPAPPPEQPLPPAAEEPSPTVVEEPPPPRVVEEPPPAPVPTEPQRDARDEMIESLRLQLEVQQAELIALREALERERARREAEPPAEVREPEPAQELEAEPPEREAEPEPPEPEFAEPEPAATPSPSEHFLLCVPTNAGYVLVDRFGVVPQVGDEVEVSEEQGNFSVTKVVRLPRNSRACAYLQRDRPAV